MDRLLTVLAGVGLALASASAHALFINFETTPGGGVPIDNAPLTSPYTDGSISVTFGWDTNNDLAIDTSARFEARGNDSLHSYITGTPSGTPGGPEDGDFTTGHVGGDFLLRSPVSTEDPSFDISTADFLIVYGGGVGTRSAAGQIWDLDASEKWTITAFDSSNNQIGASIVLDANATGTTGCCAGPNASTSQGDGRPSEFSFDNVSTDIKTIRISYTGTSTDPGFGFDNFNATGASSTPAPEPDTLLLLGPALTPLARRRWR